MIFSLVLAAVTCNNPTIINRTNEPFTKTDNLFLKNSQIRCRQKYSIDHCVKVFIKRTTERDYSVICGKDDPKTIF
jgi:hypothetical protein